MTGDRPPGDGFEVALVGVGGSVMGVGFITWLGARLATAISHGTISGGLDVWLTVTARLAREIGRAHV